MDNDSQKSQETQCLKDMRGAIHFVCDTRGLLHNGELKYTEMIS